MKIMNKIKIFQYEKIYHKQNEKKTPHTWGISLTHIINNRTIFGCYQKLIQIGNKKISNPIEKEQNR